jgi:hypothetical protein
VNKCNSSPFRNAEPPGERHPMDAFTKDSRHTV